MECCACTLVTRPAPDFTAQAVLADNSIAEFQLSALRGQYVVLFFYPMDFTFVCPTELIAFDRKLAEFKKRKTQVVAVSADSVYSHLAWKNTAPAAGGVGALAYPMVSDPTRSIAKAYGVLYQDAIALRGLFLIDAAGIVRHCVVNDLPLGRSIDEAIRMVDALQFFEVNGEVCPANWHAGAPAMTATHDGVAAYLRQND